LCYNLFIEGDYVINYLKLINETEDYIEVNLSEKITLDKLAKHLNISKYYYHHIYSKNSSETLKQFITRIKMERSAVYLVVNKDISITEVALNYGYSDASSYNKAFKKYYNKTPLQFRKARKDN
jgi:AraC family of transcriptional regulator, multidrug resistance transcriptional activator